MTRKPWFNLFILFLLITTLNISGISQAQIEPPQQEGSLEDSINMAHVDQLGIQGADTVAYHAETGQVRFIGTIPQQPIARAPGLSPDVSPEQAARGFLDIYGSNFGLKSPGEELQLMRTRTGEDDLVAVRFQQVYQGVPVIAGELNVGVDGIGNVIYATGEVLPDISIDITPKIGADHARAIALEATAKIYKLSMEQLTASEPELWIYNPALLGAPGVKVVSLVWRFSVTPIDLLPFDEFILVEAQRGSIILQFNQIDTALYRAIYDNINNPSYGLPGVGPVRVEGGAPSGVADVNNVYDYSGDTYDFYSTYHGRDSINDASMALISTVRYCPNAGTCPYPNAFWNGVQMVYGQGFASADDVVAHELTHGVTEYESGLFYYMQSGAINESFSDIWGEFVDLVNGRGNDTAGVRWLLGEDLSIGAIRSMSNPPAYGDPDRMGSSNYYCGTADNGGVHTNSGVGNKAAYLMVDGGTFNGYTISGIGIGKTARIWYRAQTQMLTSGSDYQDLHDGLAQSCNSLIGTAGITANDCDQVRRAISATEMNRQPASCAAPHAPVCDQFGFNSQFNGEANNWYATSGTWNVGGSYMYTNGLADYRATVARADKFGDIDYSVRMQRLGCDHCANGIIIRGTPFPLGDYQGWHSQYFFQFTREGNYSVWKHVEGGESTMLQGWATTPAINTGNAWNTLRVVAEGSNLFFYINADLVWTGSDSSLKAGQVGITMYRDPSTTGNELQVDWATLSGGTPMTLFYDDLEGGPGKWTSAAIVGNNEWYYEYGYATSGNHMLYGWNQHLIGDYYVRMNSNTALPAGKSAYLHFNHAFDFEAQYDGGVIEVSVNNGPWYDAAGLITHNGYNGTIYSSFGNPLGGRNAFVAESWGYRSTRLDLTSLAGQNVRFRYRIGTDSSVSNLGWLIDDVHIYTCRLIPMDVYLPLLIR